MRTMAARECGQGAQATAIVAAIAPGGGQMQPVTEQLAQPRKLRDKTIQPMRQQRDRHHPLGVRRQIGEIQMALALARAPLANGQQPRQPAPGGAVGRVAQQVRCAVAQHQPAADQ
jgi:hypothetical protein